MKNTKVTQKEKFISFVIYLFAPIPVISQLISILFLITKKKSKYIKYHSLQALLFFTLVQATVISLFYASYMGLVIIPFILIAEFILWLLFILRSFRGELFSIIFIGPFVAKQFYYKKSRR
ncbi:hypothetical protein HYT02_05815 [Candidatus Gottesmanbacteria bacterium]|nr:hypothetical protein [Candidatus Gottesmanbacteria bacterium]